MAIKVNKDDFSVDSSAGLLDFTIDTTGVNLFIDNCAPIESKQAVPTISNCTTVNCTTVQCTTVNCTTVNCTTIQCTTIDCYSYEYTTNCNCDCSSDE